tara:strand:- start:842 stop:1138 length:297 start_codon:yes stop_codon:yes gene_type:complete
MKVILYVLTSIVLFLIVFSFIVQNPHDIKIYYYFGMAWDGPIASLLLITLGVGILFGMFASSLSLLKYKIRLIKSSKRLQALQSKHSLEREQTIKGNN